MFQCMHVWVAPAFSGLSIRLSKHGITLVGLPRKEGDWGKHGAVRGGRPFDHRSCRQARQGTRGMHAGSWSTMTNSNDQERVTGKTS